MGRAVDEPDVLLQPYDLVALFPMLAELACAAPRRRASTSSRATTSATSGPYETILRGRTRKGHSCGCGAGKQHARHRGRRDHQGLPEPRDERVGRRQHPRHEPPRDLGARDAAALHARPHGARPLGLLRDLLLRRRVPRGVHVDRRRALRPPRQQPLLPPPRARSSRSRGCASGSSGCRRRPASRSTTDCSSSSSSHRLAHTKQPRKEIP